MALKYIAGEFTGIYQDFHLSADTQDLIQEFFQVKTIDLVLERVEFLALEMFLDHCTRKDWYRWLPDEAEPIAKDARDVLFQAKAAREYLALNDPKNAALCTFEMGRAFERMLVRPSEPIAKRGHEALKSARKGHEAVYGPRQKRESEWAKWRQDVDLRRARNPNLSYSAIARSVAMKFGVSERSILRRRLPSSSRKT